MTEVRRVHMGNQGYKTFAPCRDCYLPRKTVKIPYKVGNRTIYLDDLAGRPQVVGK